MRDEQSHCSDCAWIQTQNSTQSIQLLRRASTHVQRHWGSAERGASAAKPKKENEVSGSPVNGWKLVNFFTIEQRPIQAMHRPWRSWCRERICIAFLWSSEKCLRQVRTLDRGQDNGGTHDSGADKSKQICPFHLLWLSLYVCRLYTITCRLHV